MLLVHVSHRRLESNTLFKGTSSSHLANRGRSMYFNQIRFSLPQLLRVSHSSEVPLPAPTPNVVTTLFHIKVYDVHHSRQPPTNTPNPTSSNPAMPGWGKSTADVAPYKPVGGLTRISPYMYLPVPSPTDGPPWIIRGGVAGVI